MPITRFPNPRDATPEGIVALGGDLHPETLILAYSQGIFPWPIKGLPLPWFCPPERGILEFKDLHIPKSLAKARKNASVRYTLDEDFAAVIRACARAKRPDQPGTWITPRLLKAYIELHQQGHAHSIEVRSGEKLIGGIYGVDAGGIFAGESMFHDAPNTSKFALLFLIEHLASRGAEWMDIQVLTPHMQALGAKIVTRDVFLQKLAQTRARSLSLFG